MKALNCIVCGRELESCSKPNQPLDGLAFYTRGAYGTTVFDPMDGTWLEINVCDPCLTKAGIAQRVLHYTGDKERHASLWQPEERETPTPSEDGRP